MGHQFVVEGQIVERVSSMFKYTHLNIILALDVLQQLLIKKKKVVKVKGNCIT